MGCMMAVRSETSDFDDRRDQIRYRVCNKLFKQYCMNKVQNLLPKAVELDFLLGDN